MLVDTKAVVSTVGLGPTIESKADAEDTPVTSVRLTAAVVLTPLLGLSSSLELANSTELVEVELINVMAGDSESLISGICVADEAVDVERDTPDKGDTTIFEDDVVTNDTDRDDSGVADIEVDIDAEVKADADNEVEAEVGVVNKTVAVCSGEVVADDCGEVVVDERVKVGKAVSVSNASVGSVLVLCSEVRVNEVTVIELKLVLDLETESVVLAIVVNTGVVLTIEEVLETEPDGLALDCVLVVREVDVVTRTELDVLMSVEDWLDDCVTLTVVVFSFTTDTAIGETIVAV